MIVHLSLKLDPEIAEKLDAAAQAEHRSRANMATLLLMEALAERANAVL